MKIITADQKLPINSAARQLEPFTIPIWSSSGKVPAGVSPEWSPPVGVRVTGGYVSALNSPYSARLTGIAVVKNNVFVKNTVVARASLRGWNVGPLRWDLTIENPISGAAIVSPFDNLQAVIFLTPGQLLTDHEDITIQLYAEIIDS